MGRAPCCDKANVKRGPWSPEEDAKLKSYIQEQGTGGNWIALPQKIGLKRCGKSCRLRWLNYLRPNIKHGGFSNEEDNIICTLYMSIGSRWSIIAAQLPGRTDNDIKNYWNTRLKKKLLGKQRKEVQHSRRSSSCYVKVKQQEEIATKTIDDDPFITDFQANMNNIQTLSDSGGYCIRKLHPDHATMSFLENQYPTLYTTHDPPLHPPHDPIKKHGQNAYTNYDFPFNLSSNNLDNYQLLPPNDNINPSMKFPVSSTFINYSTSTTGNNSQLSNTTHAYSSDLISYLNAFPSIDQTEEMILYGFDEISSLCGVDMVNAGSFTGTNNPAQSSTSWKGDTSSFVSTTMLSNNVYEEYDYEHRRKLGMCTFEEPRHLEIHQHI